MDLNNVFYKAANQAMIKSKTSTPNYKRTTTDNKQSLGSYIGMISRTYELIDDDFINKFPGHQETMKILKQV